jgi:Fe-S cluster biogenesis protein NfuA
MSNATEETTTEEKVKLAIDKIRPNLQMDGGDIEFLGMEGDQARVRLQGACAGCIHAQQTLKLGVERFVMQEVPECKGVVAD